MRQIGSSGIGVKIKNAKAPHSSVSSVGHALQSWTFSELFFHENVPLPELGLGFLSSASRSSWELSLFFILILTFTPPKTNMEPKNEGLEDVSPFQMGDFQVPC